MKNTPIYHRLSEIKLALHEFKEFLGGAALRELGFSIIPRNINQVLEGKW